MVVHELWLDGSLHENLLAEFDLMVVKALMMAPRGKDRCCFDAPPLLFFPDVCHHVYIAWSYKYQVSGKMDRLVMEVVCHASMRSLLDYSIGPLNSLKRSLAMFGLIIIIKSTLSMLTSYLLLNRHVLSLCTDDAFLDFPSSCFSHYKGIPLVSHDDDDDDIPTNVDDDILACSRWRSRSESNVYWIIEIFLVLIYKCALSSLTMSMLLSSLHQGSLQNGCVVRSIQGEHHDGCWVLEAWRMIVAVDGV